MKILCVTSDLYPPVIGGIGVHAHKMSKEQARLGHDVTIYTSNVDGNPTQESKGGYKIIRFKPLLKLMGNSISPSLFFKLIHTRNDFDVIHAHSYLFFSTNLCALVKKIGSKPLVITNHGLISQTAPLWLQKIYIPTIAKWTFKSADTIICYTKEEQAEIEKLCINPTKIAIIHNGTDTKKFTPFKKGRKNTNQILWIGRFVPGKGVEYLIDAFHLLVKENQNLKLFMIGRGPLKENIEQRIRDLNLSKKVIMRKFVPDSELPQTYQNSDVFVLSSLTEGVPNTILEAMACGLPIVCTELPQLVDIVEGCGLLVPLRDTTALAEAISKIIFNKELAQRFGEYGRKKVVENYSWDDTVKKTIELYEEIVGRK